MTTLRVRLCPSERVALLPLFCQRPVTPIGVRLVRFEGQYGKVIVLYEEAKKIAEEMWDRVGTGMACGALCKCYAKEG